MAVSTKGRENYNYNTLTFLCDDTNRFILLLQVTTREIESWGYILYIRVLFISVLCTLLGEG